MDESNQANLVQAADGETTAQKEVWTGSWVVEDTHQTTYRTIFIATDNQDNSGRLTLAWSDPCTDLTTQVSGDYQLKSDCTINATDGIAAGNLTGAGGTCGSGASRCTLDLNADFAFYPGYHITLDGNYKISIGTGGALKQTYLWVGPDVDLDNYANEEFFSKKAQDTGPTNYVRQDTGLVSLTDFDCYDNNKLAHPNQTSYFAASRGDGSFDYDCNGTEDKEYPSTIFPICSWDDSICLQNVSSGSGWLGSVPACGTSGTFASASGVKCSNFSGNYSECTNAGQSTKTQACR